MHFRFIVTLFIIFFVAACQGPPPTQIILVVTATPEQIMPSPGPINGTATTPVAEATADITPTDDTKPTLTPTATPSPTPDVFPTTVKSQIQVAEQRFQNGRMFWLQPVDQIWVLAQDETGKKTWLVYDNTFREGQAESDPSLTPPANFHQPIRGFGKLWRENPEIRQTLGWALEPELGHVTTYEYHAGGTVTQDNEYIPAPGYHLITSLFGDIYKFNESDLTWERVR